MNIEIPSNYTFHCNVNHSESEINNLKKINFETNKIKNLTFFIFMNNEFEEIDKSYALQNESNNLQKFKSFSVKERIERINKISAYIDDPSNSKELFEVLNKDLGKSKEEVMLSELFPLQSTIKSVNRNLKKWCSDKLFSTPITMIGLSSAVKYEPKGHVLIIAPWNYPFLLAINPLIYAIGAGNIVIVKPSEIAQNTSAFIKKMIDELFPSNEIKVIEGGIKETTHLLQKKFNHVYFTGSPRVGKIVMEASAKHLS